MKTAALTNPLPEPLQAVAKPLFAGPKYEILILAPTGNDARLSASFLLDAGLPARICREVWQLCDRASRGCGSILLAEETLMDRSITNLVRLLKEQPPWSDIPITIITSGGEASQMRLRRLALFGPMGNVNLLERPFRPNTLISTAEVSLRARQRQYEVRDLMDELQEKEARLRQYVSLMPTGMYTCDGRGRITFFNQRAAEMWGRQPEPDARLEKFNAGFKVFLPDGTFVPPSQRAMAVCLREGKSFSDVEAIVERPDGSRFAATFSVEAVRDINGRLNGAICVFNDITERKRQEESLAQMSRQLERQAQVFDMTLSHISDFAYTFDREGRFTFANKPLLDLWNLSLEQAVGKNFLDLQYPKKLAARLQTQIQQVFRTKRPLRDETEYTSPTGVKGYFEYIFNPMLGADGEVEAVAGSTRIISDRKRHEAIAESQRRVLQLMVEDAPLARVLEALLQRVELESDNKVFTSILLLDADGIHLRHAAAPSLPAAYSRAIDGISIGPAAGSCGTAVFLKQPVYVADLATDPLWKDYKDLALAHGLRACWSIPIISSKGALLGTFAIYHPEPRPANQKDMGLVEMAIRTASIAIERNRSDSALKESERRYSQLVHSLPAAVYTTDAEGHVTLYNEAATQLWGRSPQIGKDICCGSYRLFRPDGSPLPLDECPMAETLRTRLPVRGREILIERPDGTRRNVMPYPDPILDASGNLIGAVNMLLDITETKRAEESSRRLVAIVESTDDAIVSKTTEGIITSWNRGAQKIFGYEAREVIGKPITILMPPEAVNEEPEILRRILRGERIEHYESVRRRKDGSLIEISLTVSPIIDANGTIIGASKIVRDITGQKAAAKELERAHKELLAASRMKDNFLATLSHELRTPLNPVLLVAGDAAENPELPEAARADFRMIRKNVELEARLIDDLLDLTRISRGKISLEKHPVDLHAVLHDAIGVVQDEFVQKDIALEINLEAERRNVVGDAVRLQQIFWNILKNAVKFTPASGRVLIESRNAGGQDECVITITDSGIGMTGGELSRIFDAFAQGDHVAAGGSHTFGGLGLGLAISRVLVEMHSGTIAASSNGRGAGSTFVVTLPLTEESATAGSTLEGGNFAIAGKTAKEATPVHILLVEDHEPTRTALAHLLKRRGYVVKAAASIAEARALGGTQPFDLLISDIGLPDGSGFELMAELRSKCKDLQGIALTGYGAEHDIERSREAGFASHLIKPVRVQSLDAALQAIMDHKKSRG